MTQIHTFTRSAVGRIRREIRLLETDGRFPIRRGAPHVVRPIPYLLKITEDYVDTDELNETSVLIELDPEDGSATVTLEPLPFKNLLPQRLWKHSLVKVEPLGGLLVATWSNAASKIEATATVTVTSQTSFDADNVRGLNGVGPTEKTDDTVTIENRLSLALDEDARCYAVWDNDLLIWYGIQAPCPD